MPDIDVEVDGSPVLLATTLPTRVALSFMCESLNWFDPDTYTGVLEAAMGALPLDSLMTLTLQHRALSEPFAEQFGLRHSPKWPLLRRMRLPLGYFPQRVFGENLLEDNGGRESPLFSSLTELVLISTRLYEPWALRLLCDALMNRVEQGVPLETLDLRRCVGDGPAEVRLLSEIVVEVLCPENAQGRENMWDAIGRGLFVEDDTY